MNEQWLEDMRRGYLATADDKIAQLSIAIQHYLDDPASKSCQRRLHRLLHNLVGSGGSYGFPEISAVAASMSELLKRSREEHSSISISSLSIELQAGLEQLRQAFASN